MLKTSQSYKIITKVTKRKQWWTKHYTENDGWAIWPHPS